MADEKQPPDEPSVDETDELDDLIGEEPIVVVVDAPVRQVGDDVSRSRKRPDPTRG